MACKGKWLDSALGILGFALQFVENDIMAYGSIKLVFAGAYQNTCSVIELCPFEIVLRFVVREYFRPLEILEKLGCRARP
jgi:hypothetical protein